jgi:hypothetical protein
MTLLLQSHAGGGGLLGIHIQPSLKISQSAGTLLLLIKELYGL